MARREDSWRMRTEETDKNLRGTRKEIGATKREVDRLGDASDRTSRRMSRMGRGGVGARGIGARGVGGGGPGGVGGFLGGVAAGRGLSGGIGGQAGGAVAVGIGLLAADAIGESVGREYSGADYLREGQVIRGLYYQDLERQSEEGIGGKFRRFVRKIPLIGGGIAGFEQSAEHVSRAVFQRKRTDEEMLEHLQARAAEEREKAEKLQSVMRSIDRGSRETSRHTRPRRSTPAALGW